MGWFSWIASRVYNVAKAAVSWTWQNVVRPVAVRAFSESSVFTAEIAVSSAVAFAETVAAPIVSQVLDEAERRARQALVMYAPKLGPLALMALDTVGESIGVPPVTSALRTFAPRAAAPRTFNNDTLREIF